MRHLLGYILLVLVVAPMTSSVAREGKKRAAATIIPEFKIDRMKVTDAIKEWVKLAEKYSAEKDRKRKQFSYEVNVLNSLKSAPVPLITLQLKNVSAEQAMTEMMDQTNKGGAWNMSVSWDTTSMKNVGRIGAGTIDFEVTLLASK